MITCDICKQKITYSYFHKESDKDICNRCWEQAHPEVVESWKRYAERHK